MVAAIVLVNGTVKGDIDATDRVELGAKARVLGNVHYGIIETAVGAQIYGKLIHRAPRRADPGHPGRRTSAAAGNPRRRIQGPSLRPSALIAAGPPSTLSIMNATSDALSEIDPPPPDVLVFTDAAAGKVGELIREEANPNLKLRVFVSGGGCSGFQYGFTFDEKIEEGDFCVEKRGVQLLIDPMSAQYLMGAEIDYKEDIQGAQFVIRNPNAKTTCGCGSSFSA